MRIVGFVPHVSHVDCASRITVTEHYEVATRVADDREINTRIAELDLEVSCKKLLQRLLICSGIIKFRNE